jgi:membrane-bound lytic murein transglycosylase D
VVLALLILFAGSGGARGQEQNEARDALPNHFPYPTALRAQVEFWKKIFATHSKYQVAIHDTENMKVYKVLDFRPLLNQEGLDEAAVQQIKQEQTKVELEQIRGILLKLHQCGADCKNLDPQEQKIWNLYRGVSNPDKFRQAASEDRLRSQSGLRERFAEGIQISRRYLHAMEAIFRSEGVPVELTRLPFVESCFNVQAYSKAGAAGIWQFIPSTGRLYKMRINNVVDERRDPLVATKAAALLLKENHEKLGTWPLAITAYNHGPAGVARAVDALGTTDIVKIIRSYRGKRFGFASRNFYPEFLAALQVEKDFQKHFGALQLEAPLTHDEVSVDCPIPLKTAARFAGADEEELLFLNPALGGMVRNGRAPVPRGYRLRLPSGVSSVFLGQYTPWQVEEKVRLAALEQARKARLAALRQSKAARLAKVRARGKASGKTASAKNGKRAQGRQETREADAKPRKRRG